MVISRSIKAEILNSNLSVWGLQVKFDIQTYMLGIMLRIFTD